MDYVPGGVTTSRAISSTFICLCCLIGGRLAGAEATPPGLVALTPDYQEVPAGGEVLVSYRTADKLPISECAFKVDSPTKTVNDSIAWTPESVDTLWTPISASGKQFFLGRYFGSGLDKGECGVALSNVKTLHLVGIRVVQGLNVNLEFVTIFGYEKSTLSLEALPRTQTVAAGSNVDITCVHGGNAPIDQCAFRLTSGKWVTFNDGHDSASTKRYHYQGRGLRRGQCGIRLLNVTASDSGLYICSEALGSARNISKIGFRVSVLVVAGGKPRLEVAVDKTVFEVGESLVATCRVTGPHPLPTTVWRLGDKTLPQDDSRLKESRNAWIWEEQSWTLELDTDVGIQFNNIPLTCELLKDIGCQERDAVDGATSDHFRMIKVKPNCGVRIGVEYDSSQACQPPATLRSAAKYIDDTSDVPTDLSMMKKLKKKFEGYPWHAGIYVFVSQNNTPSADGKIHRRFKQICGGTLITRRHVLTAGHCFNSVKMQTFKVALGKYFRDYGQFDCRVQWREVDAKQVRVHPRYVGHRHSYKHDIAVIDLGRPVMLTTRVGLACVDWDVQYTSQLLVAPNSGWLSGWGYTSKDGAQSEVLRTLALPYMDTSTCLGHLDKEVRHLLTSDKFCAGFRARNISACPGDSGGGLLFNHTTLGVYYVSGVTSSAFRPPTFKGNCFTDEVTSFTTVSEYVPWLKEVVKWANTTTFHNLFYKNVPIKSSWKSRKYPREEPKIIVWEK